MSPTGVHALLSRREALARAAGGFGMVGLASVLASAMARGGTGVMAGPGNPLVPRVPLFRARARRVIFLFMKGGPSQVDTFDPKPRLQRDDRKPLPFAKPRVTFAKTLNLLASPWRFRAHGQSGIEVSELFPNLARCVDDLCFVHSVHGTNPAHGGACLKLHTGSDTFVRPSMGAWISYGLGTENENLPAFITICPTLAHGGLNNWGSAFLPAHFQGTPIGNASVPSDRAQVRYLRNDRIPSSLQRSQLDLLGEMNREHLDGSPEAAAFESRINAFELAFRMQREMPEVQDLSRESAATRRLYGLEDPVTAPFGRQCLMARRFAERGVRCIQVTHSDGYVQWDQHGDLRKGHGKNAAEVDLPIAGLLTDLKGRGLLDETLVLWGGEFGRTPTSEGGGYDGRDHNPEGFTMWMAGGGVKGGFRYGATDDYGYYAQIDKVHIHDLHATVLALLGIDHERLTFRHGGRDFRLTDIRGQVATGVFA